MPLLGLGTWPLLKDDGVRVIAEALEMGYRHLDTAQMYGNEGEVGAAIKTAGIPREQIFLVTKIHQDRFGDGTVRDSMEASLKALGTDYVDLILAHWPPRGVPVPRVVDALSGLAEAGLARAIGVSNFNRPQMEEAARHGPILTNQVECHPLIDQSRLYAAATRLGIRLTAYMPIARGQALTQPAVLDAAARHDRTPAQIVLRWLVQQGIVAIPNSHRRDRLADNLAASDFTLEEADMTAISALRAQNIRFCRHADWEPDWDA